MTAGTIRFNARTHVGRVRKHNEDSILAVPDQNIWVVSDGMGGHEGGDFASRVVVDAVAVLPEMPATEKLGAIRRALHQAHQIIMAESERRHAVMGATVVALVLADGHFGALWAGDSRLYRLRGDKIDLLTTDHSLVAAFVEAGEMDWDEAGRHPQSNAITRAVGVGEALDLDKVRGDALPGDRFLLCSDGLNKYATIAEIGAEMHGVALEQVTDKLVQLALDRGGADNVSVIVVDIV
jgi:serine/threonine-protein phosphatase Stp1